MEEGREKGKWEGWEWDRAWDGEEKGRRGGKGRRGATAPQTLIAGTATVQNGFRFKVSARIRRVDTRGAL